MWPHFLKYSLWETPPVSQSDWATPHSSGIWWWGEEISGIMWFSWSYGHSFKSMSEMPCQIFLPENVGILAIIDVTSVWVSIWQHAPCECKCSHYTSRLIVYRYGRHLSTLLSLGIYFTFFMFYYEHYYLLFHFWIACLFQGYHCWPQESGCCPLKGKYTWRLATILMQHFQPFLQLTTSWTFNIKRMHHAP